MLNHLTRLGLCCCLLVGCASDSKPVGPKPDAPGEDTDPSKDGDGAPPTDEIAASLRPNLQWKRYAALENDLSAALELGQDELCSEFGQASCTQVVHLAPLGGHDPFKSGLLEPSSEPLATTSAVVDRVVLSACSKRALLDREAGPGNAKVIRAIELSQPAPAPDSKAVKALVTDLYRRLLARDPDAAELEAVGTLARDAAGAPVAAQELAVLACFAVGTTSELLFF